MLALWFICGYDGDDGSDDDDKSNSYKRCGKSRTSAKRRWRYRAGIMP
jgi:hypothetical protein